MRRTEFRALGGSRVYKGAIWGKQIGNPGQLVDSGHRYHPTFDINRQMSTYAGYNHSIDRTILTGEREHGIVYRCLSPSSIPVLQEHYLGGERGARPGAKALTQSD